MAHRIDLYSILNSYANKNNSPYIEIDTFLDFLGKYAKKVSEDQPEWLKWTQNRSAKFWSEISALVEEGKCELLADTADGRVYMPYFYLELIERSFQKADEEADLPFPSEESLRITIPENQMRILSSENDLLVYLNEPPESDVPPILRIDFPDGFGSALTLPGKVPRELTEMAILKIRYYLRKGGNKEYTIRKLTPQLQGRESFLQSQIDQILIQPLNCYTAVETGKDLTYLFWAHFCVLIKNDIKKKKEQLSDDIAVLQSAFIIEVINGYFKSLADKQRELETALRDLENNFNRMPFIYSLDQILKFTNSKGIPLLGKYTKESLETWLREKTTESENDKLPALLIIHGPDKGERFFLLKEKMLPLCFRFIAETRPKLKDEVSRHWRGLLSQYKTEPAMENDGDFEKLLARFTQKLKPMLLTLLEDPKLPLVSDETEQDGEGVPSSPRLFNRGQLLPYSVLFILNRKELLSDARLFLPFWYSIPIISSIIAFFKNLSGKRKAIKLSAAKGLNGEEYILDEKDRAAEIRAAAEELEFDMVPAGYTMDSYLEELESRWSRLINRQARENLIEDVKSLVRDQLRRNLKIQKQFQLSQEVISQMASNTVTRTPPLAALNGRDSLILYAELYMIKLLQNIK